MERPSLLAVGEGRSFRKETRVSERTLPQRIGSISIAEKRASAFTFASV